MSKTAGPATARRKYRGMLQILRYNWPYYVVALAAGLFGLVLLVLIPLSTPLRVLIGLGLSCAVLGLFGSLLVSHYVYDLSQLYRWQWIAETLAAAPARWVNIHAGLDETSSALRTLFPEAQATVWEIYDSTEMTEPSIARARRLRPADSVATQVDFRNLPLESGACDAAFVIFTAHELRSPQARLRFFNELHRVLKPWGHLLLVEHVRDLRNFVAFGPGFLHFYPRQEWVRLAGEARFSIAREFNVTPFVKVFLLTRPGLPQ